ncbi:acyltransferase [Devosia sp. PTR5]|uniref:Acyltransferase n=1 Tax=Devosia oryzisoli TaxID=2774138 RepID=A0A927IUD1_9HYPH|nr:acyltransferase [Devosia oryzisoli]MBD8066797.1 acyltransferase [Devosia oryzisoli]
MRNKSGTIDGVQYLRGIAALFVVAIHASSMMAYPEYFGKDLLPLEQLGSVGVSIFFVISGFVITIVTLDRDLRPKTTMGEFFARRFSRIVPFMWICILGYNALTYLGTHVVEWGPFLRALVLWPVGELKPNVLWTLRQEFQFYVIFALCMLSGRRALPWLIAWFLLPLPLAVFAQMNPGALTVESAPPVAMLYIFGLEGFANLLFGGGFLIAWLWLRSARQASVPGGLPLMAGLALLTGLAIHWLHNSGASLPIYWLGMTLLSAAVVGVGVLTRPSSGFVGRLGNLLGNASYSIYLIHNAVLLVGLEVFRRLGVEIELWLGWIVLWLGAIGFGVLLHLFVEVPVVRLGARMVDRRFPRGRAAASVV